MNIREKWHTLNADERDEWVVARVFGWRKVPTSCQCGGEWAWLKPRESGAWEMVGCVCHHTPHVSRDLGGALSVMAAMMQRGYRMTFTGGYHPWTGEILYPAVKVPTVIANSGYQVGAVIEPGEACIAALEALDGAHHAGGVGSSHAE